MLRQIRGLGRWAALMVLATGVVLAEPPARVIRVAQKPQTTNKKKADAPKKGATAKPDDAMAKPEAAPPASKAAAPASGELSFRRDIAPILVANCVGCHSGNGPGVRTGKYDMSTFEKLMAGGKRGKDDVVPGDSDSSRMILMIKGEETPRMPPRNGQRGFSDEAGEKIAAWIKAGAKLDAGLAATDLMNKYAATPADLRKAELDKLPPDQRDKVITQAGLDRWKKATKVEPEVTTGAHFLLLSNLPKARADTLLKKMEDQYKLINRLLTTPSGPALAGPDKIGLYVFKEANAYAEFVRAVETQEIESGEPARAKLGVESPYVVAIDPAHGGDEATPAAAPRKGVRKPKKGEDSGGPDRTLAAVLTESLAAAAANQAGKPPKWVALGLGAYLASSMEPNSPYYRRLRAETAENVRIGWLVKANEALGGQAKAETVRAVGFSLFEWMAAYDPSKKALANVIQVMLGGQDKLDEALGNCLELNREAFLNATGEWFLQHYGRGG